MSKKTKTRNRRQHNLPPKTWNVTELLYAFVGILTTRKQPLIFSAEHNCAPIAEMVAAFIEANKLPHPRPDYPVAKWPKGTDHLTNVPEKSNVVAYAPLEAVEALKVLRQTMNRVDPQEQDYVIGAFLSELKAIRRRKMDMVESDRNVMDQRLEQARNEVDTLENILRGTFSIINFQKAKANGEAPLSY